MSLRVGLVSAAHVHTPSYAHHFGAHNRTSISGLWDDNPERGRAFADQWEMPFFDSLDSLLEACDAVAISSENTKHLAHIQAACATGKHILCEKPVVVRAEDFTAVRQAVSQSGVTFMTAFPCRFSPTWQSVKQRVKDGKIGELKAIMATNRGTCPGSWFIQTELSGGGAMIDHVVHVADLLFDLFGEGPTTVVAQKGNNMYGQDWDDTAMVTLQYESGVFVSLDSSWSRPASYRTWGDVTMKFVGTEGTISIDLFAQSLDLYKNGQSKSHVSAGYGSDLDGAMIDGFVRACLDGASVPVTLEDGLRAVEVALKGYMSANSRTPVTA